MIGMSALPEGRRGYTLMSKWSHSGKVRSGINEGITIF
jgi:hypothetical protein